MKKVLGCLLCLVAVMGVTSLQASLEYSPRNSKTGVMPKDNAVQMQYCNGFWCGYGDNAVCCNREWNSCCHYPNSNSYYCCDN